MTSSTHCLPLVSRGVRTELSKEDETRITPEIRREIVSIVDERLRETQIIRSDLAELKGVVKKLTEAQRKGEQRLTRQESVVEKLAEAQKRTEERVEELAEAQRNSEQRLSRLEAALVELAQAQKRTEQALEALIADHWETRTQSGGLSSTVGYRLEDEAFKALPDLLKRDYGIVVMGRLKRQFVKDKFGQAIGLNIIGEALRDGKKVTIVGEGKSQLSKNGGERFREEEAGQARRGFRRALSGSRDVHDQRALRRGIREGERDSPLLLVRFLAVRKARLKRERKGSSFYSSAVHLLGFVFPLRIHSSPRGSVKG